MKPITDLQETFGDRLKQVMEDRKVTLKQIAVAVGKTPPAVHKWTKGGDIDFETLRKLAKFLEVNWIWLRYGNEALREVEEGSVERRENSPMNAARRQRIQALMDDHSRLMLALETNRIVSWEWNTVTNAIRLSNNAEEMFGVYPETLEEFLKLVCEHDRARYTYELDRTARGESFLDIDACLHLPDNRIVYIEVKGRPISDKYGHVDRVIGVSTDITERKKVEEEAKHLHQRLYLSMHVASEGSFELDLKTKKVCVDPRACRIFGVPHGHIKTQDDFLKIVHPDDKERVLQSDISAPDAHGAYILKFRIIREDGEVRWVREFNMVTEKSGHKKLIGMVQDITESERNKEALQQRSRRLELALEAGGLGVWEYDVESRNVSLDDRAIAMFGRPKDYKTTNWDSILEQILDDDRERIQEDMRRFVHDNQSETHQASYRVRWPDNSIHTLRQSSIVEYGSNGAPKKLVGVLMDHRSCPA